MASLEQIGKALQAADAAGAADDARSLARLYQKTKGEMDMRRMANPTGTGWENFTAGAGKAVADLGRGAGQVLGMVPQADIDESRQRDKPLMGTGAGLAGNITGNVAAFAPTVLIPGANTYTGAALIGATAGALSPTATGESRAANVGLGAAGGMAGQFAGNMLGRALKPVSSQLSPEAEILAQKAGAEGIPLTAGQRTGSRPLQTAESVMENLPLTSGPQLAQREAQKRAFTAAALRKAGISADAAIPEILMGQKSSLGSTLGGIAERNSLPFDKGLGARLSGIAEDAIQHLPPDEASKIAITVKKILSGASAGSPEQVVPSRILSESGSPFTKTIPAVAAQPMEGALYQGWREPLRNLADNTATGRYYGQIRKAMDEAFSSGLTGADASAFSDASRKYANLKTIMQAAGGPGADAATNQLAPTQLAAALRNSMGKEGVALGRGDLNDLTRIGTTFVKDQIPNSGTAQRQLIQGLLTSGVGAGAGGGTAYAMGKDPLTGAGIGAGLGAGTLLAPRIAQALMNSKAGQTYLSEGLVNLTQAERQALSAALRTGTLGGVATLEGMR